MLRIKVNTRVSSVHYEPIGLVTDGYILKEGGTVLIPSSDFKGMETHDVVSFHREDGSRIRYEEERMVNESKKDSGHITYSVNGFPDIPLYFESGITKNLKMKPDGSKVYFLILDLKSPHHYVKNRDGVSVTNYVGCELNKDGDIGKFCRGEYAIFNNMFLYKVTNGTNLSQLENYTTTVYLEDEGQIKYLNAIVPCTLGGRDDVNKIMLYGDVSLIDKMKAAPQYYTIYGRDERFFAQESPTRLRLQPGAEVRWRLGDMRVSLPVARDFDVSLNQDDAVSQYIESRAEAEINPIIDYEKQQFVPVYRKNSATQFDLSRIEFKIHLRDRGTDFDNEEFKWKTNDDLGWYNSTSSINTSGDSVYYMGFDGDDIYYQKKKVSQTFLRLSLYDTMDRRTQKLLYTAKIYLNSANLYGQYIENIANGDADPLATIETEFVCTHKYDYDNPTEGFYFHLFPSNIDNNDEGVIYLKCELNNAKYGYTLPLVLFANGFRGGYFSKKSDGSVYVNMPALYSDMYIPILIRKSESRYEWEFYSENIAVDYTSGTATLNLFEPRVNGTPSYGQYLPETVTNRRTGNYGMVTDRSEGSSVIPNVSVSVSLMQKVDADEGVVVDVSFVPDYSEGVDVMVDIMPETEWLQTSTMNTRTVDVVAELYPEDGEINTSEN